MSFFFKFNKRLLKKFVIEFRVATIVLSFGFPSSRKANERLSIERCGALERTRPTEFFINPARRILQNYGRWNGTR